MRYISTRGQAPALNFEDVLLAGLASDGGLYVPENLPRFTQAEIASAHGVTQPAVSQSLRRSGGAAVATSLRLLQEVAR